MTLAPESSGRAKSRPLMKWLLLFPASQRAAHRNPVCVLRKAEAPLRKHPRIYALRTLHQPPSPGKAYRRVREGKERDEKPQRAAAFAAIHRAGHRRKGQAARSF